MLSLSCHKSGGEWLRAQAISFSKSWSNKSYIPTIVGCRALRGCHREDLSLGSLRLCHLSPRATDTLRVYSVKKCVTCYIKRNYRNQISTIMSLVSSHKGRSLAVSLSPVLPSILLSFLSPFLLGALLSLSGSRKKGEINHILRWVVLDPTLSPLPLNWSEMQQTSRSFCPQWSHGLNHGPVQRSSGSWAAL